MNNRRSNDNDKNKLSEKTENENSIESNDDNNTIQESLREISINLNYMLIMQIVSLGAFLGYVGIDRLR